MKVKKEGLFARVIKAIKDTEHLTTPVLIKEATDSIM